MTNDQFDELIKNAAHDYQEPPVTPREEIWARIQTARRAGRTSPVVDLASRSRSLWIRNGLAIAAVLLLGVAVGRWSLPELEESGEGTATAVAPASLENEARGAMMVRFVAVEHLGQIDALLTDYETGAPAEEFQSTARALLSRTRLLLGSKRLTDSVMKRLLSDLELVLVQVAQLAPDGHGEDRALIDDNLAEQAIRPRVRKALRMPLGFTI